MSYCRYHPRQAATQVCNNCNSALCNACTRTSGHNAHVTCLSCGVQTERLGVTADVQPFWRRLDEAFRYPLKTAVLVLLCLSAAVGALLPYLPWPVMVGLSVLVTGIVLKYCFNCLVETADGQMQAPDITTAYRGGVFLILQLIVMIVLISVAVGLVYGFLGEVFGAVLGMCVALALPAMIILFALSESVLEAMNPIKLIALIAAIGVPYGLILGILSIMLGSVSLLSELLGNVDGAWSLVAQSVVSNYYSVVMFHLMGYMIFQYQDQLGYCASAGNDDSHESRTDAELGLARVRIFVKEGAWPKAQTELKQALQRNPNDKALWDYAFQFTLARLPQIGHPQLIQDGLPQLAEEQLGQQEQLGQPRHQEQLRQPRHQDSKSLDQQERQGIEGESIFEQAKQVQARQAAAFFDRYLAYLLRSQQSDQLNISYKRASLALGDYCPAEPELRHEIAKVCYQQGASKTVVNLLKGLHEQHPDYPSLIEAYELLAQALDDVPHMQKHAQRCNALIKKLSQGHVNQHIEEMEGGRLPRENGVSAQTVTLSKQEANTSKREHAISQANDHQVEMMTPNKGQIIQEASAGKAVFGARTRVNEGFEDRLDQKSEGLPPLEFK